MTAKISFLFRLFLTSQCIVVLHFLLRFLQFLIGSMVTFHIHFWYIQQLSHTCNLHFTNMSTYQGIFIPMHLSVTLMIFQFIDTTCHIDTTTHTFLKCELCTNTIECHTNGYKLHCYKVFTSTQIATSYRCNQMTRTRTEHQVNMLNSIIWSKICLWNLL